MPTTTTTSSSPPIILGIQNSVFVNGLYLDGILTSSQRLPFSCENSGWQSAFKCKDYVKLAPIKLAKGQNHPPPCKTENHPTHTEDDESRTDYGVCCVLTYKEAYGS